jgi:HEPN domain-containing protein
VNRAELRQLASDRIEDARILLAGGRWSAAYYLLGYAVETGLKACILKLVEETGVDGIELIRLLRAEAASSGHE